MERAIRQNAAAILAANAEDVAEARSSGESAAFIDRLTLTPVRIETMADGIITVRNIADPVGMQDFTIDDTAYVTGPDSVYAAYPFRMTARDMARFGALFLRQGNWPGTPLVQKEWVG